MWHTINSFSGSHLLRQPSLGILITVMLLMLLIAESLLNTFGSRRAFRLSSYTAAAAIPLLVLFALIVIARFSFVIGE